MMGTILAAQHEDNIKIAWCFHDGDVDGSVAKTHREIPAPITLTCVFYIVLGMQKQGSGIIFCFPIACRGPVAQQTRYGNKGGLPWHVRQFVPGVSSSVDPIVAASPYSC